MPVNCIYRLNNMLWEYVPCAVCALCTSCMCWHCALPLPLSALLAAHWSMHERGAAYVRGRTHRLLTSIRSIRVCESLSRAPKCTRKQSEFSYSTDWTIIQCEFIVILFDTHSHVDLQWVWVFGGERASSEMNRFQDPFVHSHVRCARPIRINAQTPTDKIQKTKRRERPKFVCTRKRQWEIERERERTEKLHGKPYKIFLQKFSMYPCTVYKTSSMQTLHIVQCWARNERQEHTQSKQSSISWAHMLSMNGSACERVASLRVRSLHT